MPVINVVYENGVFRPTEPVEFPEGASAQVFTASLQVPGPDGRIGPEMDYNSPEYQAHLDRVYEILGRRHDDGGPGDIAERHNEHQP